MDSEKAADLAEQQIQALQLRDSEKRHMSIVLIGHVDAGKSTICGQILLLSGKVDERDIQKYKREAKENNRESWYLAYIMDTGDDEREKGITVHGSRRQLETEHTRFTLLDSPGHKTLVHNMISAASQADVAVLVISARKGEFESGYNGDTREHVVLAKALGISKIIVVVNKMDEATVSWSKARYDEIVSLMIPCLKKAGYKYNNVKKDVQFLPVSGQAGLNITSRVEPGLCPWWQGPSLFEALDATEITNRDPGAPLRMSISPPANKTVFLPLGRVECGIIREGDKLLLMPNKAQVKVIALYRTLDDEGDVVAGAMVPHSGPGENLLVKLSGVGEKDVLGGCVLCSIERPIRAASEFVAKLEILRMPSGLYFVPSLAATLHFPHVVENCVVGEILYEIDRETGEQKGMEKSLARSGAVVVCRIEVAKEICVEKYSEFAHFGRFSLRQMENTLAIGMVTKFPAIDD